MKNVYHVVILNVINMSRSYKYPIQKQRNNQYYKKLTNKKIRKYLKTLKKGFKTNKLRLLINPWCICDWKQKSNDITKTRRK